MKWYGKIISIFMVIAAITCISTLYYLQFAKRPQQPTNATAARANTGNIFEAFKPAPMPSQPIRYTVYEHTNMLPEPFWERNDIIGSIYRTGTAIVKALMPPEAQTVTHDELQLLDDYTAEVTGKVIIPGKGQETEKLFAFKVKVYFFPNGSTQAAFPEFTPIQAQ